MMDKTMKMKMQYLGVLRLLGECSVHIRDGGESADLRDCIAEALADAQTLIPELRWHRLLNRFDVDVVDEPDVWPGEEVPA
jgi:hypothetical protein